VGLHAGVTAEQMQAATGWPIRFAPQVEQTPPPTATELHVLRDLQKRTARAHGTAPA
jgi:glutaconate CoA-transferase subunit B